MHGAAWLPTPAAWLGRPPNSPTDTAQQRRSSIVKKLHPDQKGSRRLSSRFGDRLACVRCRIDRESERRFTTVEIVIEERALATPAPSHQLVRVGWDETALRNAIKAGGGTCCSPGSSGGFPQAPSEG